MTLDGLKNTNIYARLNDIDQETYLAIMNSLDKIEELFKSSSPYC